MVFQAGDMAAMEYQLQQAGVALPGISASAPPDPGAAQAPLPPAPAPFPAGAPIAGAGPTATGAPAAPAPPAPVPTAFLEVAGMVTPDVLVDEQEYREVRCLITRAQVLACAPHAVAGSCGRVARGCSSCFFFVSTRSQQGCPLMGMCTDVAVTQPQMSTARHACAAMSAEAGRVPRE